MYFFILVSCVVVLDQATKLTVSRTMMLHDSVPVFGSFIRFTFIRNSGIAFGLKPGNSTFFIVISIIAIIILLAVFFTTKRKSFLFTTSMAAITGGALGNLIDRVLYHNVIDFIDMGIGSLRWPIFNVADIAVTVGVVMALTIPLKRDGSDGRKTCSTGPPSP